MLKYELTDIYGRKTWLKKPLRVNITASSDAPADSLMAVFAVEGRIPELRDVRVTNGQTNVFYGFVDEQIDTLTGSSNILEVRARSQECLLLDNEAMPQTYCMPSMPVLLERHFRPFGFTEFTGPDNAFNGELTVSKGMSEWEVLESFCRRFLGTKPRIDDSGSIDITGGSPEIIYIGDKRRILSMRRKLRRSVIISNIKARTYMGGEYSLRLDNPLAVHQGVVRNRYVNAIDSKGKSIDSVRQIMNETNNAFENYELEFTGSVICRPDDIIRISGVGKDMKVRELHYILNEDGEKTRIYTEVLCNVDI